MNNLALAFCFFLSVQALAQAPRKLKQDTLFELKIEKQSLFLTPPGMDDSTKYPLVVFLPFTGGSARDLFNKYLYYAEQGGEGGGAVMVNLNDLLDSLKRMPTEEEINNFMRDYMEKARQKDPTENYHLMQQMLFGEELKKKAFFTLVPEGAGSTKDHSWQGFEACIFRYENKILKDVDSLSRKYNIDQSKIILFGHSLGGDLSWAITQRYPEKFRGAIVSGSRCSYSEKGMMQRQVKQGVKYCFVMGEQELEVRMKGAQAAIAALDKTGIKNKLMMMPNAVHESPTFDQLKEALNFVLFE